jgi:hypothetical protein
MGGGNYLLPSLGQVLLGGQAGSSSGPDPHRGRELLDLSNFGGGQAGEQIFQVIKWVDAEPPKPFLPLPRSERRIEILMT